jgi:methylenetetrahydrofolate dehydrogenase (NADP+)/methenyltetrahydrofolate cyclohydrolase
VIVDVGYGYKDGKAVGDVDFTAVVDRVKAITPVP